MSAASGGGSICYATTPVLFVVHIYLQSSFMAYRTVGQEGEIFFHFLAGARLGRRQEAGTPPQGPTRVQGPKQQGAARVQHGGQTALSPLHEDPGPSL